MWPPQNIRTLKRIRGIEGKEKEWQEREKGRKTLGFRSCTFLSLVLNKNIIFLIHSAGLRAKQGKESLFWNTFSDDHRAHANHRKQLLVVGYYSKWPYFFRDTPQQYKHDNTFLLMQIWTHVCNNNPLVFIIVFFTVLLSFGGQLVQATWVTLGQTIFWTFL